jgi:outer membrane protein OmpA-like peptidoglycan-associated protein
MRRASKMLLLGAIIPLLELAPGAAWAACEQAKAFFDQAKATPDLAAKAQLLQKSLKDCKTFAASYELSGVYFEQKLPKEAEATVREALNLATDKAEEARGLARLGQMQEAWNQPEEALQAYKRSYQAHPYPRVQEKIKELETKMVAAGVSAESIKRSLKASRAFGVEATVDLRVPFDYNSAALNPQGAAVVKELGQALSDPAFQGKTFTLVGHTDKRGTDDYNNNLSRQRAESVKAYLVQHFRFSAQQIRTEGKGKSQLLYPGDAEQDHALNRRVEVRVQ